MLTGNVGGDERLIICNHIAKAMVHDCLTPLTGEPLHPCQHAISHDNAHITVDHGLKPRVSLLPLTLALSHPVTPSGSSLSSLPDHGALSQPGQSPTRPTRQTADSRSPRER